MPRPSTDASDDEVAPDRSKAGPDLPPADAVAIRTRHLDRESTSRTIGLICLMTSAISFASTIVGFISEGKFRAIRANPGNFLDVLGSLILVSKVVGLAFVSSSIGIGFGLGLRRLVNWVRVLFMMLVVIGFAISALGLLDRVLSNEVAAESVLAAATIALFLAFAVFLGNPDTRYVFSRDYRSVIAATPEMTPSTGRRGRVFLLIYSLLVAAGASVQAIRFLKSR